MDYLIIIICCVIMAFVGLIMIITEVIRRTKMLGVRVLAMAAEACLAYLLIGYFGLQVYFRLLAVAVVLILNSLIPALLRRGGENAERRKHVKERRKMEQQDKQAQPAQPRSIPVAAKAASEAQDKALIRSELIDAGALRKIFRAIGLVFALVYVAVLLIAEFSPAVLSELAVMLAGAVIIWIAAELLCRLVYKSLSKNELVVTDSRVCFRRGSRRLDLPLDFVSAVGAGWMKSVVVSTPSGVIRMSLVNNRDDIHSVIAGLMVQRQHRPVAVVPGKQTASPAVKPAPKPEPKREQQPEPKPEPQPPVQPVAQPEPKPEAKPEVPHHKGRCMMCGEMDVPVKTVKIVIGGTARARDVCDVCAEKYHYE